MGVCDLGAGARGTEGGVRASVGHLPGASHGTRVPLPRLATVQVGQPTLKKDDWDRARIVDEDLAYLIDIWQPSLDEAVLRRDSPMLRRLLVEGQYARAWRDLGLPGEPYVSAPDFAAGLGETTGRYVQFATSPPGVTVANSLLAGGKLEMGVLQACPWDQRWPSSLATGSSSA